MSIATRITSIEEHIRQSYQELKGLGIDTTNINKNLENIPKLLDNYWEYLPKVTGNGTNITLNDTKEAKMKLELLPDTQQYSTTGKNLLNFQDTTHYVTNTSSITALPTGVRATIISAGNYKVGYYIINDITELKGKSFKIIATITPSASNKGDIRMFGRTSSGIADEIVAINGVFNIPNDFPHEKIAILFYGNSNGTGNAGDYVDYTNLMFISSSSSETPYEPYTNGASPNPNYPQEIKVVTGNQNIKVSQTVPTIQGGIYDNGGEYVSTTRIKTDYIEITNHNQIYVSSNNLSLICRSIYFYNSSKTFVGKSVGSSNLIPHTFQDIPIEAEYFKIVFQNRDNSTDLSPDGIYAILKEQNYPLTLGTLEYCKIGTYSDEIYKKADGKWYLKHNIWKNIFNGNQAITKITVLSAPLGYYYTIPISPNAKYTTSSEIPNLLLCSNFAVEENQVPYLYSGKITLSSTKNKVCVGYNGTSDELSTYFTNNNTALYYILETPTEELLNNTLQEQLNTLENAMSYDNQTNINNSGNLASILNANALQDLS